MKPHGSKFEYEKQRDLDLLRAFRICVGKATHIAMPRIYREVVNMPAQRFWVSEERAAIVIAAMMRGDKLQAMSQNKREMFNEIYRRAMQRKKEAPKRSVADIAAEVVTQQAPKFYLTPGSAKVIICKARKKWSEEKKRKLQHLFM